MELLFEKSRADHKTQYLPACELSEYELEGALKRSSALELPELAEFEVYRHYSELERQVFGVNDGFYPLGSCTMKYNPCVNNAVVGLKGFTAVHPLQEVEDVQGCLEALAVADQYLCEITGMDKMCFQPAAGAHGELTGMMLIKAYHEARQDTKRTKVIIPDSAHGTNPATCSMVGYEVVNLKSNAKGAIDLEQLRKVVGEDTAALMLTNPNTLGLFDENILEITKIIKEAGGLCYYDGANLNGVMGIVRPGDMGFDVVHLNLHKTFSTPHGGGGPGSGTIGCKSLLIPFLPGLLVSTGENGYELKKAEQSIGSVKAFYGNFLVVLRALAYVMSLGKEDVPEVAKRAVLNANYLKKLLEDDFDIAYKDQICMHEFIISLEKQKKSLGVNALDFAKALLDRGMHPPTMYFPLIVEEALMVEPTETENIDTLDRAAEAFKAIMQLAKTEGESLHQAPVSLPIGRPDETAAARNPILRYQ